MRLATRPVSPAARPKGKNRPAGMEQHTSPSARIALTGATVHAGAADDVPGQIEHAQ